MEDTFVVACKRLRELCDRSAGSPISVGSGASRTFSREKLHSAAEIAQFESQCGVSLPESYKYFLCTVGAGKFFMNRHGLGIVFPSIVELREFSRAVFENAAPDPFPRLLLIAGLTRRGDFAGFDTRSSHEKFAVFSHEEDPEMWGTDTEEWHEFSDWIEQLVASDGAEDLL